MTAYLGHNSSDNLLTTLSHPLDKNGRRNLLWVELHPPKFHMLKS